MEIANPIYDVVFKYLMEDSKAAKTLLSALLGQEIVELNFLPQEISMEIGTSKNKKSELQQKVERYSLTIYRMDFSAKIQTEQGQKQIIIELQKVRLKEDITRFRAYLGKQYQNKDLFVWIHDDKKYKAGLPIFSIYFLGYELNSFKGIPTIIIENQVIDRFTKKILDKNEPFVSSLFHQGMIVNILALQGRRRDYVEKLLSIFDQSNQQEDFHILNVDENDFPEEKRIIIRRLQAASKSMELRQRMLAEDDFLGEIQELEEDLKKAKKEIEEAKQEIEEAKQEVEEAKQELEEAKQELEASKQKADQAKQEIEARKQEADQAKQEIEARKQEADQAKQEIEARKQEADQAKQELEASKQKADQAKQEAQEVKNKLALAVQNLAQKGFEVSQIAQILSISKQDVQDILG